MAIDRSSQTLESDLVAAIPRKVRDGLREIVIFIDGCNESAGILEFAGIMAQQHGAHLIGVFMQPDISLSGPETFARGTGIVNLIKEHQSQLERIEANYRARFEDTVRRYGIRFEWRSSHHFASHVDVHAQYADLAIIARPEITDRAAGPRGLMESLVLRSGRPTILLPPHVTVSQIRRVLIGWNASPGAIRATADALPLLVRAEAVQVLVVDDKHDPENALEPASAIERHLARHGAPVEAKKMSSNGEDVGRLLLSQAETFGADLIVMGAYGHSHLSEWIFGGVTLTALREATVPVLMSH